MLVTVSEQCDQKIMSIRDEEKQGKLLLFRSFIVKDVTGKRNLKVIKKYNITLF